MQTPQQYVHGQSSAGCYSMPLINLYHHLLLLTVVNMHGNLGVLELFVNVKL